MNTTNPGAANPNDPAGKVDPAAISRGHEVDVYDSKSVFSVPLLVVLFFALAFGTVTLLFFFIAPTPDDPGAHPQAKERNQRDLKDRLQDIPGPRLEDLKLREGNSQAISQRELPTGNSPWIQPDNLRVNPTNTPALYQSGWLKGKSHARIGIDDAMALAIEKRNQFLPSAELVSGPIDSRYQPTAANAGRGASSSRATPPPLPEPPPKVAPTPKAPPKGKK
jgi:hypothetical protein